MGRLQENKKELITAIAGLIIAISIAITMPLNSAIAWGLGYALGLAAVVLHLLVIWMIKDFDNQDFIERYYLGIFVRFLVTIGLFSALLALTEIEQIPFTLSFIISYIFHSGIDIILINKKFTKRSSLNS